MTTQLGTGQPAGNPVVGLVVADVVVVVGTLEVLGAVVDNFVVEVLNVDAFVVVVLGALLVVVVVVVFTVVVVVVGGSCKASSIIECIRTVIVLLNIAGNRDIVVNACLVAKCHGNALGVG